MSKIFLKPAPGLAVINPQTDKPLPPEGAAVELTTYWRRRLNDGDVVRSAAPVKPKKPKAEKKDG